MILVVPSEVTVFIHHFVFMILLFNRKKSKLFFLLYETILLNIFLTSFLLLADVCHHYCVNSESCTISDDGSVECVCPVRFEGPKCEVDKCIRCHGGHCIINKDTNDIVCK